jgi:hypothetical protein
VGGSETLSSVLLAWVASRVVFAVVALLATRLSLDPGLYAWSPAPLTGGLTAWDGLYYLGIARDGYHAAAVVGPYHDWVFFPLFPLVTALVAPLVAGSVTLAGILVANGAALLAFLALAALGARRFEPARVRWGIWLMAFAPAGCALVMTYSDSLMLALLALALLAAERGQPRRAGVLYALSVLARPPAALFVLPVAIAIVRAIPADERRLIRIFRSLVPLGLGPAALAGFCAYQGLVLGDPLAWLHGQDAWTPSSVVTMFTDPLVRVDALIIGTALCFYVLLLPIVLRSRPGWVGGTVALMAVAALLISERLLSAPRYLLPAYVVAFALAGAPRRLRWVTSVAWVAIALVYATLVFAWRFPP